MLRIIYINISSHEHVDLFSSVFKKNIPNNSTPTFQEVGGETQPLNFVEGIIISHGIALTITKLISTFEGFLLFCLPLFLERQLKAKIILPHGKILKVTLPLFWLKILMISIARAQSVLDKNTNIEHVKTTAGFQKYVHCDMRFLAVKISTLHCFLNCFVIAVPVFSY